MKNFLLKILIYTLPIVLVAVGLEIYVESIPNSYTYKRTYMEQHAAEIKTLILGSSYAYDGIDVKQFTSGQGVNDVREKKFLECEFNNKKYTSKNGLFDLLTDNMTVDPLYPIIHLKGEDIEIALTHTNQSGEEYHSFVNGQHTVQGGTHQVAFREAIARTIKEFFNKIIKNNCLFIIVML